MNQYSVEFWVFIFLTEINPTVFKDVPNTST